MTANELADWMENSSAYKKAATMLRQQQAEIESLKLRELTDEEIWKLWQTHLNDDITVFARAILKKASEK